MLNYFLVKIEVNIFIILFLNSIIY